MADEMKITNLPDSGSVERVAYDLMTRISAVEIKAGKRVESAGDIRGYYLDLYEECYHVVRNGFRAGS